MQVVQWGAKNQFFFIFNLNLRKSFQSLNAGGAEGAPKTSFSF
jgi:hypothetical protein